MGGLQESHGLVTVENDEVIFEFATKDALFGIVKSSSKRIAVKPREIVSATYRETWFSTKLEFRFQTLQIAGRFPGNEGPELVLKVRRKDRNAARSLYSRLESLQASVRLDRLEQEIKRNEITDDML